MSKEKIFDASKQPDKLQDKSADELLSEKELDNVAGGNGGSGRRRIPLPPGDSNSTGH